MPAHLRLTSDQAAPPLIDPLRLLKNRFPQNLICDLTHILCRSFVTKSILGLGMAGEANLSRPARILILIPYIRVVVTSAVDHNPLVPAIK
jgi:hypothetical protein